jgi:murein L,D-transpeptidase YcbB/YkuD
MKYHIIIITILASLLFPFAGESTEGNILLSSELSSLKGLNTPIVTQKFYENREYAKAWKERQISALIDAIGDAEQHGLNPADYLLESLTSASLSAEQKDILATDSYLTLAGHLLGGKVSPVSVEPTWTAKGREHDLVAHLEEALKGQEIKKALFSLAPSQPRYNALLDDLKRFKKLAKSDGWLTISSGSALKLGMMDSRVIQLRDRLAVTENITVVKNDVAALYDDELARVVKNFQKRTNLEPDGVVGPDTLKQLNLTVQDRINQLRVNMERWRWLPEDLGSRHLRVDIANFRLESFEDDRFKQSYDIVVGRTYRQTPVFSDRISYLVVNPWWGVPDSIAKKDKIPEFQKHPKRFETSGFEVLSNEGKMVEASSINWHRYNENYFPYRIRQKPGPNNALGRVKFMFPNIHDVYLHDTPLQELFGKNRRDFSSGCVRVKDAFDLMEWVLSTDTQWDRKKIDEIVASGKETRINLATKLPVHLLYWTAIVDDKNNVRFIDDIYDRDAAVLTALNSPSISMRR